LKSVNEQPAWKSATDDHHPLALTDFGDNNIRAVNSLVTYEPGTTADNYRKTKRQTVSAFVHYNADGLLNQITPERKTRKQNYS